MTQRIEIFEREYNNGFKAEINRETVCHIDLRDLSTKEHFKQALIAVQNAQNQLEELRRNTQMSNNGVQLPH